MRRVTAHTNFLSSHRPRYIVSIAALLLVSAAGRGDHIVAHHNRDSVNENVQDSSPSKSPDTSKWKLYRDEKYGFQVKYPETWAVSSSRGTRAEIVYFKGPYRGVMGRALSVTVQLNLNPRKLSIDEWFAVQMRAVDAKKLDAMGCSTIVGQPHASSSMRTNPASGKATV